MSSCYCLINNHQHNICFALIKFALIKRYHLHMCNRVLLLFGKLQQWNIHVNCHVNWTAFQSGFRFQTGLSSLRVSCKRVLGTVFRKISPVMLQSDLIFSYNYISLVSPFFPSSPFIVLFQTSFTELGKMPIGPKAIYINCHINRTSLPGRCFLVTDAF